jgi:hypothetical protein
MAMEQTYSRALLASRETSDGAGIVAKSSAKIPRAATQRVIPADAEQLPANKSCRRAENSSEQQRYRKLASASMQSSSPKCS